MSRVILIWAFLSSVAACHGAPPNADHFFRIEVRDEQSGRGVPLVELMTTNNLQFITDSAGVIAFDEPGLMNTDVFFHVRSHGYEFPADGFGIRGVRLAVRPGEAATIKVKRVNIAERLYRVTGGGIYRDSALLGDAPPIDQPQLNGMVLGQDSVLNVLYRGKIRWFWGDTNRPAYPLGNFQASGATSLLPRDGGLDPAVGVNLTYFVGQDGFSRGMAPLAEPGAVWIDALVVADGASNRTDSRRPVPAGDAATQPSSAPYDASQPRMLVAFARVKSLEETLERGIMEYNNERDAFERVTNFAVNAPVYPSGHPLEVTQGDKRYWYFARGVPLVRCERSRATYLDVAGYEAFTCLKEGTPFRADGKYPPEELDREQDGQPRYAWRRNAPPLNARELAELVKSKAIFENQVLFQPRDPNDDTPVMIAGGSCYWNPWRGRWVMIFGQLFGSSVLGEIWYAEADTPVGPWVYSRKIITHDKYSFYNPKQDVLFDQDGGRTIFVEGTYASTFSGNEHPTPRYDYNQIMYRLRLDDPRLVLPAPVYETAAAGHTRQYHLKQANGGVVAFFACDRPAEGLVPIVRDASGRLHATTGAEKDAVFYALPATGEVDGPLRSNSPAVVALYEYVDPHEKDRLMQYSTNAKAESKQQKRSAEPICRVWKNPLALYIRFDDGARAE